MINRQSKCIQIDPYANAFNHHPHRGDWFSDHTDMKEELHERKWEIDSLCYPVRLAYHFWKKLETKLHFRTVGLRPPKPFLRHLKSNSGLMVRGPYRFGRTTSWSTDTVPGNGYGNNTRPNGLIHSTFRPSDDATLYPFLIPANYFALVSLKQMAEMSKTIYHNDAFAADCTKMAGQIKAALDKFAQYSHPVFGKIIPMEIDGFGNHLLQDDANVPNLLAMPYLGTIDRNDPLYVRTRKFVLSDSNPYFSKEKPHKVSAVRIHW